MNGYDPTTVITILGIVLLLTGLMLAQLPVSECPHCQHCRHRKGLGPPPRP